MNMEDRSQLMKELSVEIYELLHEHGNMIDLTLVEALGVLELLKIRMVDEQFIAGAMEEDDDE